MTAELRPRGVEPQQGDLAYIEMAVSKLKKEYPELDKVKIDSYSAIVFETKSLGGTGQISARDKRAADYLSSQEFLEECRKRLRLDLVEDGRFLADLSPSKMHLHQRDMPHIEKVFAQLKKEYPELNHPMIDSYGTVRFDTREKPKGLFQKIKRALSPFP
ncbi:MAG: hypothetical protein K8R48_04990 [Alphaproteobacteria bacterium]|nr:hypothetical protein [Alphaproteobacteria bacterium]